MLVVPSSSVSRSRNTERREVAKKQLSSGFTTDKFAEGGADVPLSRPGQRRMITIGTIEYALMGD